MNEELITKLLTECNEVAAQTLSFDFYLYLIGFLSCILITFLMCLVAVLIHKEKISFEDDIILKVICILLSVFFLLISCANVIGMLKIKIAPKAYILTELTK